MIRIQSLPMYAYVKQSGELLASNGAPGDLWTPDGVRTSAEKVVAAHKSRKELGLRGLVLVSGAGNIIRGEKLRAHGIANGQADLLGRLATIQNTLVLAHAIRQRDVPVTTLLTPNMTLGDISLAADMRPHSLRAVYEAFEEGHVVLVGGGTGQDNVTTDNAVMTYANQHRAADAEAEVIVLKGTKFDGVFEGDPAKNANALKFTRISAQLMLDDYDKYPVVDKSCLEQIRDSGLAMRVYRDGQHDLVTVLASHGTGLNADAIGSLIYFDPTFVPSERILSR